MELKELLDEQKSLIIEEATQSLQRTELRSYRKSPADLNRERITKLLELTTLCVSARNLIGITEYSEKIAKERFDAGYNLHEVHSAFNVLEETIWKRIIANTEPSDLGKALGLISTVLGAGKESLALAYVMLAGKNKTSTINLSELFGR